MPNVYLPFSLTRMYPGAPRSLDCEGATVSAVLDALDARWPGMRGYLADASPRIRRHILIFVDGEKATLETEIGEGSRVEVIPAISGG